jgi:hypothetical protein
MIKKIVFCTIFLAGFMWFNSNTYSVPIKIIHPIDVSGKVLDKNGNLFTGDVEIKLRVSTSYLDFSKSESQMQSTEDKYYKINAQGGIFSWKGEGSDITVKAVKEGYYSTKIDVHESPLSEDRQQIIDEARDQGCGPDDLFEKFMHNMVVKRDDIVIYLIPKGTPAKLEYVGGADIPSINSKKSSGKQCGWSFAKRWYFPVDGDVSVDIIRGINENNKRTYTMKEPGGFIYFEGYPVLETENKDFYPYASFDLMTEAPETGYVSTFTPAEHRPTFRGNSFFCYFKTPDGKYGKICFEGDFSYYINPDGSRNLEAGEVEEWDPINPIEANRHKR